MPGFYETSSRQCKHALSQTGYGHTSFGYNTLESGESEPLIHCVLPDLLTFPCRSAPHRHRDHLEAKHDACSFLTETRRTRTQVYIRPRARGRTPCTVHLEGIPDACSCAPMWRRHAGDVVLWCDSHALCTSAATWVYSLSLSGHRQSPVLYPWSPEASLTLPVGPIGQGKVSIGCIGVQKR